MTIPCLQFGVAEPGRTYADRPATFGIAEEGGRIALVRVVKSGQAPWHDLPGGALDPGETDAEALAREFGEETGLVVEAGMALDRAAQFFISDGRPYRNVGPLMTVRILGQDSHLKIEADHELVWAEPAEALSLLRHDSHAWAVTCWLRSR